jgi:hypothetical protein
MHGVPFAVLSTDRGVCYGRFAGRFDHRKGSHVDAVLMTAIAVGLVAGSLGFVLARFVLAPLARYKLLKRRIEALAIRVEDAVPLETVQGEARVCALSLQGLLDEHLPRWYRLALQNRGERPAEAVRHLQFLAGCRDAGDRKRRAALVRASLRRRGRR